MKKLFLSLVIISILTLPVIVMARGGGGGSSSGGGGGGGSSHSSGGSSSRSSSGSSGATCQAGDFYCRWSGLLGVVFVFGIPGLILYFGIRQAKKRRAKMTADLAAAASADSAWTEETLKARVTEVFLAFQSDWSTFNVTNMKAYLEGEYYKKMVLELSALQNIGRRNVMANVSIQSVNIINMVDKTDDNQDEFTAQISARANDQLWDDKAKKQIYHDTSSFIENWNFIRQGKTWVLKDIRQTTEEASLIENDIANFAKANNFYYDADFGWLMMPARGAIFSATNFTTSDVNNHVIGYFRDKIVEFYTYIPVPQKGPNYLVAQAILPINYRDILLKKKQGFFGNGAPNGLEPVKTEWGEFNDKFLLFADRQDQATSFELLTTNFMAKIYDLPFEINIEVVDNVLYIYSVDRQGLNYDELLKILSWAFDEMKM